jgi:hypothetical protein
VTAQNLAFLLFLNGVSYMLAVWQFRRRIGKWQLWLQCSSLVLGSIVGFATIIFPHIKAEWGGGAPTQVIFYMSHVSNVMPDGQLSASLLDESDAGFYVVLKDRRDAIFLPRTAIASIVYSAKPLPQELLRGTPAQAASHSDNAK